MRITNLDTLSAMLDRLITERIKWYFFKKENKIAKTNHQLEVIDEIKIKINILLNECFEDNSYSYKKEFRTFKEDSILEELEELIINDINIGEADRERLKTVQSDTPNLDKLIINEKRLRKANEGRARNKNRIDKELNLKFQKPISQIINEAFKLYMPQEQEEITQLAEFVRDLDPKVVVEIGTKNGGTLMIWNEVTKAQTISIDLIDGIHGGVNKEKTINRNNNFKELYGDRCSFIEGNSHNQSTIDVLIKSLNGELIDFLFIDGDHTYEGVKQDFKMYKHLVKSGGWIVFHDINDTEKHRKRNVFVGKFWGELKGKKIEFNVNSDWAGIGVIQM